MIGRTAMCLSLLVAACDRTERERIHGENLQRAEAFRRGLDERFPTGTPLAAVDDYLRTQPVSVHRTIKPVTGTDSGQLTRVDELMIEVANEKSLTFGCGRHSVGVIAKFAPAQLLQSLEVSSWSFDCM
jgi:hypothetical protein